MFKMAKSYQLNTENRGRVAIPLEKSEEYLTSVRNPKLTWLTDFPVGEHGHLYSKSPLSSSLQGCTLVLWEALGKDKW